MTNASLDSLPNEVLSFICSYLKPYYKSPKRHFPIEQLSRTNKRLRSVATPFRLKERYENVKDEMDRIIPLVLRDILQNPGLAQYVRSLSINTRRFGTKAREEEENYYDYGYYEHYDAATMDLIHENFELYGQAIRKIIPESLQDKWVQAILMGNDEPLISLLILHCPQLKTIQWEVNLMHETLYFFDYLRATAMNPEVRPSMNINHVRISRSLEHYEFSEGLLEAGFIQPILTLPSLKDLDLDNVWGEEWLSDATPKPSRYSNLESLNLRGCSVTAEIMEGFCSAAIALENLTCERTPICQPMTPQTDSSSVLMRAIEKGAAHSLRSLYITGNWDGEEDDERLQDLPSLKNSLALTNLKVDPSFFDNEFGLMVRDGQVPGIHQSQVGIFMPPNLETLVLEGDLGAQWTPPNWTPPNWKFVDRLLDLLATKNQFTPKLTQITLYHDRSRGHLGWGYPEIKELSDSCKAYNVELYLKTVND